MKLCFKSQGRFRQAWASAALAVIGTIAGGVANAAPMVPVPAIASFSPLAGAAGTSVTITGTHFSSMPSNNIVYFGGMRATVLNASDTSLTVAAPSGANYAPITVTIAANGLTACANASFLPTYPGGNAPIQAGNFGSRIDLPTDQGPAIMTIADVDGDGKPDLIVGNTYSHTISIFRNIGTNGALDAATFAAPVNLAMGSGVDYGIVAADIDGDGKQDFLFVDRALNRVVIVRNLCTPGHLDTNSFAAPVSFPTGTLPADVTVRDLDGDGKPDLVVANLTSGTLSIFRNLASAGTLDTNSFAPAFEIPTGSTPQALAIGDLDGDGWPDIVVGTDTSGSVSLYRNLGTGDGLSTNSFAPPVNLPSLSICSRGITLGDVDGDGKLDILLAGYLSSTLSVYHNEASPGILATNSFGQRVDFPLAGRGHTIALSDLNGDGKPEILVATELASQLLLYPNQSIPGSFTSESLGQPIQLATGYNAWGVAAGDLNGDGIPDLVFANCYDNTISLYPNYGSTNIPPPAPVTPPPDLVAWWRAEGNGNESVGGNNATWLGDAAFAAGKVGRAFQFAGTNSYLRVPASPGLDVGLNGGLTLELWINPTDVSAFHPMLEWNDNTNQIGVHFWIGHFPGDSGVLFANLMDRQGNAHQIYSAGGALTANVFQHVALTYDQATGMGTLYINGAVVAQENLGVFVPQTSYDLWLSRRPVDYVGSWTYGSSFAGLMDEISVYARALGVTEIQSIYHAGSAGKITNGVPPSILTQPTNLVVLAGSTATFSVAASGDTPLSFQWRLNGVDLADGSEVAGAQTPTLRLGHVFVSAQGNYSVVVRNAFGRATSRAAALGVTFAGDSKTAPRIAIAAPTAGRSVTGDVLVASGTASSRKALSGVWYRLNDSDWTRASGTTNWTATLNLTQRTNLLRAVAMDANGSLSPAASVRFYWAQMARLTVQTNGQGTITPDYGGRLLEIGKTYALTAQPKAGWLFSGWEGDWSTNTARLSFVMQTNLVLQADFIASPFPALKGAYAGLFQDAGNPEQESSGWLALSTADAGAFSGNLQIGNARYPLSGRFDLAGAAAKTIARSNLSDLTVTLQMDLSAGSGQITGTVSDGNWTGDLLAHRAWFNARTNPAPEAGQYTLMFTGDYSSTTQPCGHGYGTVRIDKSGQITLSGVLADGTRISQAAPLSRNGQWPLYVPLYSGQGSILGWMSVDNGLAGDLTWIKPSQPKANFFRDGFTAQVSVWGSPYAAPGKGTNLLGFMDGTLVLKSGDQDQGTTQSVRLDSNNRLTFLTLSGNLTFVPSSGWFRGSVTDPTTLESFSVQGVVLQNWNVGCGFFLGPNAAGGVLFGAQPQLSTYPPNWYP